MKKMAGYSHSYFDDLLRANHVYQGHASLCPPLLAHFYVLLVYSVFAYNNIAFCFSNINLR